MLVPLFVKVQEIFLRGELEKNIVKYIKITAVKLLAQLGEQIHFRGVKGLAGSIAMKVIPIYI